MTFKYTNSGFNFVEQAISDESFTETMNTIAVGDGGTAPRESNTALENQLYEDTTAASNISIERAAGTGEIRATIEFTGGREVPSDSDIVEFGFKDNSGTLLYREVRDSAINVVSGETISVEIQLFIEDADSENEQTITNVGLDYIANRVIGNTTDTADVVAVGDGTGTVSPTDTQMSSELYRADNTNSNTIVKSTTTTGQIRVETTISAGNNADDEVAGGSDISEFGIFTKDSNTMLFHEKRAAVTLETNDSKTFKIPFNIIQ